jgi:hypothetical protein
MSLEQPAAGVLIDRKGKLVDDRLSTRLPAELTNMIVDSHIIWPPTTKPWLTRPGEVDRSDSNWAAVI